MATEAIFTHMSDCDDRVYLLRASFVEIYNEEVRDLLCETKDNIVNIREDPRVGVYCTAVEVPISDYDGIMALMKKGSFLLQDIYSCQ